MALGIEAYRTMAESGISQLALISDKQGQTRIGDASESKVGFLKRLFNTSASKKLNIAVTSDFKAAIASKYNAAIAEEAFAAVIGNDGLSGAKLSATVVAKTLTMVDQIVNRRLAPPQGEHMMLTMRLDGRDNNFNLAKMADADRKTLTDAQKALTTLHDLLMDMPTDMAGLNEFKTKIAAAKAEAETLLADHLPKIDNAGNIAEALRKAVLMVNGKIDEATEVCDSNPVTYKALSEFAGKFIEGAKRAISSLPNHGSAYGLNGETSDALAGALSKLTGDDGYLKMLADSTSPESGLFANATESQKAEIRKVIPELPKGATANDMCPDPKAFIGKNFAHKLAKYCTDMIMQDLKANLAPGKAAFEETSFAKDLEKSILKEMTNILNEGNWDPIEKTVTFSLDGASLKGKSVITPAAHMGGAITKIYDDNGPRGYSCQSFGEPKHAVNLAHSEFKVNIDGRQQTVFAGIRHGVHAAVDIEQEKDFKAANISRAKETLIAAFTGNPSLVAKALANPSKPCEFVFNSVSLLTPDFARSIFGDNHENEKKMLRAQTEAYRSLDGKPIEVDVPTQNGQSVKVKIQPVITTFNYGVNWGGVGMFSALFGGWGESKDMNAKGLINLNNLANKALTDIDAEIARTAYPDDKKKLMKKAVAIRTLLNQINSIDRQRIYSTDGHEAYKMASRIAVLTNLLGGVPAWNCKSGKDRTGMMDVECKFLATLVALGKEIPEPGAQLTKEQKFLYRNILLQSGNHEMQKYNTGVAGYKLEGVDSITERIGDIASQKVFLGASKIVKS